jgi:hypothetical protein
MRWFWWLDLNQRPPPYQDGALAGLSYTRTMVAWNRIADTIRGLLLGRQPCFQLHQCGMLEWRIGQDSNLCSIVCWTG